MTQQQPVNWNRVAEIEPLFARVAGHWSARTGEDPEDIASTMRLHVVERATEDPTFLSQKPSYILTFAGWRALDQVRAQWRDGEAMPLDDLTEGLGTDDTAGEDGVRHNANASICKTLGDKDRALALAIIEAIKAGDEVLKKNQTLNISALAQSLGRPERTANHHVAHLRSALAAAGAV